MCPYGGKAKSKRCILRRFLKFTIKVTELMDSGGGGGFFLKELRSTRVRCPCACVGRRRAPKMDIILYWVK